MSFCYDPDVANRTADEARLDVEKFVDLMFEPHDIISLVLLNATFPSNRVPCGFFTDRAAFFEKVSDLSGQGNVYVNINPLSNRLRVRGENHFNAFANQRFTDTDVVRRRTLLVDVDPVRPSSTSSTKDELNDAVAIANQIAVFLQEQWEVEPLVVMTGNGVQLLYRINAPTESEAVSQVLAFLDARFTTTTVKVDTSVSDAARITRLPGTLNMKGEDSPERPHRLAIVLSSPDAMKLVETEKLEQLTIPLNDTRPSKPRGEWTHARLRALLDEQYATFNSKGWSYRPEGKVGDGYDDNLVYFLEQCPFVEHADRHAFRAMIWLHSGVPCFKCFSPDCDGINKRTFGELLRRIAPDLTDDRHVIWLSPREETVVNEAVAALASGQDIFQRGGALVRIDQNPAPPVGVIRDTDAPSIALLPKATLREKLTSVVKWMQMTDKGPKEVHPTAWAVEAVLNRSSWPVPNLLAIANTPFLRADGSIADTLGYDPATGVFCNFAEDLPPLPSIEQARGVLQELVCDFPFESNVHAAAWVAALLTPFASHAFAGPAPLFLADANTPGSGKSLLMDLISLINTGHTMPRMSAPDNDEEWRKRITSIVITGEPLVLIDNVDGQLGSPSLDAALTSDTWEDRLLGANRMVKLPLVSTWFATGNNVALARDTTRRTVHIRLVSHDERPEERTDFGIPNILDHVRKHRMKYVACALSILHQYCRDGRPDMDLTPWGSFQGWSDLVRSCIVNAGLEDPGKTRSGLAARADTDSEYLRLLHSAWLALDPEGRGLTVADALSRLDAPEGEGLRALFSVLAGRDRRTMLVTALRKYRERVLAGRMIDRTQRGNVSAWFVTPA